MVCLGMPDTVRMPSHRRFVSYICWSTLGTALLPPYGCALVAPIR